MKPEEARTEFRRLVAEELPKVRTKLMRRNGRMEWVKASRRDAALSQRISTRLAELHAIMFGETTSGSTSPKESGQ